MSWLTTIRLAIVNPSVHRAVPPRLESSAPGREDAMTAAPLTAENFEQVVTENEIVLVDFWAAWCGPCRQFAPIY
jgi:thioredoxin-like negative regulator of GroEL